MVSNLLAMASLGVTGWICLDWESTHLIYHLSSFDGKMGLRSCHALGELDVRPGFS